VQRVLKQAQQQQAQVENGSGGRRRILDRFQAGTGADEGGDAGAGQAAVLGRMSNSQRRSIHRDASWNDAYRAGVIHGCSAVIQW